MCEGPAGGRGSPPGRRPTKPATHTPGYTGHQPNYQQSGPFFFIFLINKFSNQFINGRVVLGCLLAGSSRDGQPSKHHTLTVPRLKPYRCQSCQEIKDGLVLYAK